MFSRSRTWALGATLAQVLVVGHALGQQGTAVLSGTVRDASNRAPLPNVVVTVTSPALQGEQIVVTDQSGSYRVPNLPPGAYTLTLEGDGFKHYARGGVNLVAEATIRLNAELLPESLKAEEIEVVAEAPTVDIGSSSTGKSINKDFSRRVPAMAPGAKGSATRSFEAVAAATPGAKADQFSTSISGTTSPENQYSIDGLSVNNTGYGFNGAPLSVEFVAEVNIISGGYMPEYGRATGGILNAVTKTGSNKVAGSVWSYFSPGFLEGPRTEVVSQGDALRTRTELSYAGDVGFDIGGPIVKDKLWYYAGLDVSREDQKLTTGVYKRFFNQASVTDPNQPTWQLTDGLPRTELVPGTEEVRHAVATGLQVFGKLTFAADDNNKLNLTALFAPTFSGGLGKYAIDPRTGAPERGFRAPATGDFNALAHRLDSSALDLALKWSSEHENKRLLFDTSVGWHHETGDTLPHDGSRVGDGPSTLAGTPNAVYRQNRPRFDAGLVGPDGNPGGMTGDTHDLEDFRDVPGADCTKIQIPNPAFNPNLPVDATNPRFFEHYPCPAKNYIIGGAGSIQERTFDRFALAEVATYFAEGLGHHVVKIGADVDLSLYTNKWGFAGGHQLRESTAGTSFSANRGFGYLSGPDTFVVLPYLQQSTKSITAGGFVQDSWSIVDKVTLNAGVRYDAQFIYGGDGELALGLPHQVSPRVGLIYDPTQEGRSKLFANWARFYEGVPLDLADRSGSNRPSILDNHSLAECDPRNPADAARGGRCWSDNRNVLTGPSSPDQYWLVIGTGKTPVDPDIDPQSSDEIVFGGEYEFMTDTRGGVSYKRRWMNAVIEDLSRDGGATYFLGNPSFGIAEDFPAAVRDYDEVTLYVDKAFKNDWLASLSYTWSHLRGNYSGLFRPETGQLDPNISSDFDLIPLLENKDGDLPGDRRHYIKLYGAKDFRLSETSTLLLGLGVVANSGAPTGAYGSHAAYGPGESFILERGAGARLPWQFNVDSNLGYTLALGQGSTIGITVETFNLLNLQGVTGVDEAYTANDVSPNLNGLSSADGSYIPPGKINSVAELDAVVNALNGDPATPLDDVIAKNANYAEPVQFQAPRSFRFGIRFTY